MVVHRVGRLQALPMPSGQPNPKPKPSAYGREERRNTSNNFVLVRFAHDVPSAPLAEIPALGSSPRLRLTLVVPEPLVPPEPSPRALRSACVRGRVEHKAIELSLSRAACRYMRTSENTVAYSNILHLFYISTLVNCHNGKMCRKMGRYRYR